MPLVEVYPKSAITATLITAGPWFERDEARASALRFAQNHFNEKLKRSAAVAEISEDGYKHVHLALEFATRTEKVYAFKFLLLEHMRKTWKTDPEDKRLFNVNAHLIPKTEPDMQGRSNFDHIAIKYMTKPTKDKAVDKDIISNVNKGAMSSDFCASYEPTIIKFESGKTIEIPPEKGDLNKTWKDHHMTLGDRMATDYKFYKSQSEYTRRNFDKNFKGNIVWKSEIENLKTFMEIKNH